MELFATSTTSAPGLFLLATVGFSAVLLLVQLCAAARYVRKPGPRARHPRPISILKPLAGIDDELVQNLEAFARLAEEAPAGYELLLGVRDESDAAYPVACAFAERHPSLARVVLQRAEVGRNPKVNQLVTLAAAARHDLLVVSDSNTRPRKGWLAEIAGHLEDPEVGLVTSPIVGMGERSLGASLDNVHLTGWVGAGMIAVSEVCGRAVVVGKAMALHRRTLEALGGFEAAANVLGEDWVMGRLVETELGLRVAVTHTPIENISCERRVADFYARYQRWCVMHRMAIGLPAYACEVLLNPIALATLALVASPGRLTLAAALGSVLGKMSYEALAARLLRRHPLGARALLAVPLKDLVHLAAFVHGLVHDEVCWRGHVLRVLPGTRLVPVAADAPDPVPVRLPTRALRRLRRLAALVARPA
jgi:ceramide glucosyltransferase